MRAKKIGLSLILFSLFIVLNGCVFLVAGTVGAVGGYAITRDTMQGEYDAKFSDAWKASLQACSALGTITSKSSSLGVLEATVDRAKVKVEITQLTLEAVRVKVKARKGLFPRLGTAEHIFVKIVQQLM